MEMRILRILTLGLALVFVIGGVSLVKAQEYDEFTLEEITVTAQKREENQQKVPITMDVISGDLMKELGQNDLSEVLFNISSAIVYKVSNEMRVSIRGISNDQDDFGGMQASTPTVAVNKDGIYTARKSSGQNLYDIERVEVLYGPQSTMYASNSPGGIVNIITADPKLDKFEGSGSIEYGNYHLLHTEGFINAPINETVALRGSFSTSVRDGYISNGRDNDDTKSARVKALYKPNERFSIMIAGETAKISIYPMASVNIFINESDVNDPWEAADPDKGTPSDDQENRIYGNINWDLGFGTLAILPAHYRRTNYSAYSRQFGPNLIDFIRDIDTKEDGAEARITSPEDSRITWVFGGNWYEAHEHAISEGSDGSVDNMDMKQTMKAIYGNVTYPVTDRFRLTGGLRYSDDAAYAYSVSNRGTQTYDSEWAKPNIKIGAEYDLNENSMIYGSYGNSYRIQAAAFSRVKQNYPTEHLNSFSIGSKNRFFGNKLQLNTSAYYYKYKNYLAIDAVDYLDRVDINGDGDFTDEGLYYDVEGRTRNETIVGHDWTSKQPGDLDMAGVDVQASMIITSKDKLDASVSYMRTEFTKLFFDFLDVTNETTFQDVDLAGAEKTYSPHLTSKIAYSHNFNLNNGDVITARADATYQSSYFLTWQDKTMKVSNDLEVVMTDISRYRTQEAYHLINLSAVYADGDGKWTITGYVKNLQNYAVKRSWMSAAMSTASGGPAGTMAVGEPRTYGAVLSVRF